MFLPFLAPEVIDKKIIKCSRIWNEKIKCYDFVEPAGTSNSKTIAFRTCPHLEKDKLVFQMGTADADLAVQAAKVVARDVAAIDVNSGCPKHFSVHGGMGAALMKTPDKLVNILTSLVTQVGEPFGIPISVKIRLLGTETETLELVRRLVKTGVKLVTIHCRTTPMRPREPSIRTSLKKIVDTCHEANVLCFLSGDVEKYSDLQELMDKYGIDGAIIARAAQANPSCFDPNGMVPWHQIAKEFYETCEEYDNHVSNTKFCLAQMIPGKSQVFQKLHQSKTMDQIKEALESIDEATIKKYNHSFKSPLTIEREMKEREKEEEAKGLKRRLDQTDKKDDKIVKKKKNLEYEVIKSRYLAV